MSVPCFNLDAVRDFVVDNFLFGDATGFTDDTSFRDASILDSTGILELITYLEKTFQIKLTSEDLTPANLDSINRINQFVQRTRGPAGGGAPAPGG